MKDMRLLSVWLFVLFLVNPAVSGGSLPNPAKTREFKTLSPDGKTTLKVSLGDNITYQIESEGFKIIEPSVISMELTDGKILGANPTLKADNIKLVNSTINTTIYKKQIVRDNYNQLILKFKEGFSVEFRVYDDGVAYRFVASLPGNITVKSERAEFNFGKRSFSMVPVCKQMGKRG